MWCAGEAVDPTGAAGAVTGASQAPPSTAGWLGEGSPDRSPAPPMGGLVPKEPVGPVWVVVRYSDRPWSGSVCTCGGRKREASSC